MHGLVRALAHYLGRYRTCIWMVLNVHRVAGHGRQAGVGNVALNTLSLLDDIGSRISRAHYCRSTCSWCTFCIMMFSEVSLKVTCGQLEGGLRQQRQ